MELISFHDRIYGKYKSKLYTFEPTWDSFRPILGIGWNGEQFIPIEGYDLDYTYWNIEKYQTDDKPIDKALKTYYFK
jgi:hypothetical protein